MYYNMLTTEQNETSRKDGKRNKRRFSDIWKILKQHKNEEAKLQILGKCIFLLSANT